VNNNFKNLFEGNTTAFSWQDIMIEVTF